MKPFRFKIKRSTHELNDILRSCSFLLYFLSFFALVLKFCPLSLGSQLYICSVIYDAHSCTESSYSLYKPAVLHLQASQAGMTLNISWHRHMPTCLSAHYRSEQTLVKPRVIVCRGGELSLLHTHALFLQQQCNQPVIFSVGIVPQVPPLGMVIDFWRSPGVQDTCELNSLKRLDRLNDCITPNSREVANITCMSLDLF